jgi:hypothetical protein
MVSRHYRITFSVSSIAFPDPVSDWELMVAKKESESLDIRLS